ncbi:hypothetical protein [Pseudomonas syringae]|uniref:hypothetical protein n=1 Tax=Pseudomonas syringae TaxID=317 RepID=UPI001142814C|nr:hypothetical protein [Pseudomonas syringae]
MSVSLAVFGLFVVPWVGSLLVISFFSALALSVPCIPFVSLVAWLVHVFFVVGAGLSLFLLGSLVCLLYLMCLIASLGGRSFAGWAFFRGRAGVLSF